MDEDFLKELYEYIGASDRGIPFDEFKSDMSSSQELRKAVYEKIGASKRGIEYAEFEKDLGVSQPPNQVSDEGSAQKAPRDVQQAPEKEDTFDGDRFFGKKVLREETEEIAGDFLKKVHEGTAGKVEEKPEKKKEPTRLDRMFEGYDTGEYERYINYLKEVEQSPTKQLTEKDKKGKRYVRFYEELDKVAYEVQKATDERARQGDEPGFFSKSLSYFEDTVYDNAADIASIIELGASKLGIRALEDKAASYRMAMQAYQAINEAEIPSSEKGVGGQSNPFATQRYLDPQGELRTEKCENCQPVRVEASSADLEVTAIRDKEGFIINDKVKPESVEILNAQLKQRGELTEDFSRGWTDPDVANRFVWDNASSFYDLVGLITLSGAATKGTLKLAGKEASKRAARVTAGASVGSLAFQQSFGSNYRQALRETDGDINKSLNIAATQSAVTGVLTAAIGGFEAQAARAFAGVGGPVGRAINGTARDFARGKVPKGKVVTNFLKDVGEKVGWEIVEENTDQVASNLISNMYGIEKDIYSFDEFTQTTASTILLTAPLGALTSTKNYDKNNFLTYGALAAAKDIDAFDNQLNELVSEGQIGSAEAAHKRDIANRLRATLDFAEGNLTDESQREIAALTIESKNLENAVRLFDKENPMKARVQNRLDRVNKRIEELSKRPVDEQQTTEEETPVATTQQETSEDTQAENVVEDTETKVQETQGEQVEQEAEEGPQTIELDGKQHIRTEKGWRVLNPNTNKPTGRVIKNPERIRQLEAIQEAQDPAVDNKTTLTEVEAQMSDRVQGIRDVVSTVAEEATNPKTRDASITKSLDSNSFIQQVEDIDLNNAKTAAKGLTEALDNFKSLPKNLQAKFDQAIKDNPDLEENSFSEYIENARDLVARRSALQSSRFQPTQEADAPLTYDELGTVVGGQSRTKAPTRVGKGKRRDIQSAEDVAGILNTFDNFAENSDQATRGDYLLKAKNQVNEFLENNPEAAEQVNSQEFYDNLTDQGKTAFDRYFKGETPTETELGPVTDQEFQDFVDNDNVSQERLQSIANKVAANEELSEREAAIFTERTSDVEALLVERQAEEEVDLGENPSERVTQVNDTANNVIDQVNQTVEQVKNAEELTDDIEKSVANALDRTGDAKAELEKAKTEGQLSKKTANAIEAKILRAETQLMGEYYSKKQELSQEDMANVGRKLNEVQENKGRSNVREELDDLGNRAGSLIKAMMGEAGYTPTTQLNAIEEAKEKYFDPDTGKLTHTEEFRGILNSGRVLTPAEAAALAMEIERVESTLSDINGRIEKEQDSQNKKVLENHRDSLRNDLVQLVDMYNDQGALAGQALGLRRGTRYTTAAIRTFEKEAKENDAYDGGIFSEMIDLASKLSEVIAKKNETKREGEKGVPDSYRKEADNIIKKMKKSAKGFNMTNPEDGLKEDC